MAMGAAILAVGVWAVRLLATPVPPEPDIADLTEVQANYHCTVCGMRLTVTRVQGDESKPPRHCREEMDLEY
ncbi:MAG: hypothetical protein HKN74_14545 [Acidimicrobiia bacterium]|nr:hypothetical protein [Acidimicrobiia bacterium]